MTQEEKFKIWDATNPEVKEVKAYLARMCGQTPLPLVYQTDDVQKKVVTTVLPDKKGNLVGILIDENTMLFLRAVTAKDIKQLLENSSICVLREPNVNALVKAQFTDFPNPRAATKQDIKLLDKKRADVLTTFDILDYHGVKLPKPCWEHLGRLNKGADVVERWDGDTRIDYYVEAYGDLLVFADFNQSAEQ